MKDELRNFLDRGWINMLLYSIVLKYLETGEINPGLTVEKQGAFYFFRYNENRKDYLIRLKIDKDEVGTI